MEVLGKTHEHEVVDDEEHIAIHKGYEADDQGRSLPSGEPVCELKRQDCLLHPAAQR